MNLLKHCSRIFFAISLGWTCSNLNLDLALPAAGAQKSAGDFQFSSIEPDSALQEQGFAKMNWAQHECQRFERAGKQSLNYGEYDNALSYFDQSLRFRFNEGAAVGKARCLLKLNRPTEALVLLKRANETTTSQEAWDLRIACLIELKRYDEALAICDEAKQSWYPDYPSFLLRSKVYLAQGQKNKAIKSLMDGYYHCTRYGVDKQPLRHALFELDIDPPDTVPHVKTGNEEILAIIQSLVKLDRPLNERGYASYFQRTLTPSGFGAHNMPATEIDSTNRLAPLEQLSISLESGEITVRSNLDFTYLTREDLRAKFGALMNSEPPNSSSKNEVVADAALRAASADSEGSELYLPCSNGWLKFDFRATDKCQLYFIHRHFSSISRPEPIADGDFLTLEKKVHQFILLKKYKEAFAELARSWSDSYASLSDTDFKQRMEKKKQLLILAYSGQPEVQAYLHVAPFAYIAQDIQKKERLGEELPTVREYRKHQWFTSANVTHPAMKSSYFTVWAETYPAIYVPHDTSLFRRLYSDISNAEILGGGNWSKISFVNGNLIDEADAVGEVEANRDKVLKR